MASLLHFRDPGAAVVAALIMVDEVPRVGLPPAQVGLHAGPVVFHDGDYYGSTARLGLLSAGLLGARTVVRCLPW